jgi:hypothetical protein
MKNISLDKPKASMTLNQVKSVPNLKFEKKYSMMFKDDKETLEIQFESRSDLELLKFSPDPQVRKEFFLSFSNSI